MKIRKITHSACVCLFSIASCQILFGQATGIISGSVTDPTGSSIPGAKVTLVAPATGLTRVAITNDTGEFVIPSLGPADYNFKVEKEGFQSASAQGMRLQVDERRELNFKLFPATVQPDLKVSATPVAIKTETLRWGR